MKPTVQPLLRDIWTERPFLSFAGKSLALWQIGPNQASSRFAEAALAGCVYVWVWVSYITTQVGHIFL